MPKIEAHCVSSFKPMSPPENSPTDPASTASPLSEPLLDSDAAAALLSVRRSWIYEAVRDGRLPHVKVGRHIRFLRADLESWVFAQRRGRLF
jgi:excisionase family DNA binding protein